MLYNASSFDCNRIKKCFFRIVVTVDMCLGILFGDVCIESRKLPSETATRTRPLYKPLILPTLKPKLTLSLLHHCHEQIRQVSHHAQCPNGVTLLAEWSVSRPNPQPYWADGDLGNALALGNHGIGGLGRRNRVSEDRKTENWVRVS